MINEIKRRLENDEIVELECVDRDKFESIDYHYNKWVLAYFVKVKTILCNGGLLLTSGKVIAPNEIKYFKIK